MYKLNSLFVKVEVFFLILFSFLVNYYYGSIGVLPQDTFAYYDSAYRILNGAVPFKDLDSKRAIFRLSSGRVFYLSVLVGKLIFLMDP